MPQVTHRIVGVLELTAVGDSDAVQFRDLQRGTSSRPGDDHQTVGRTENLLADVVELASELREEYRRITGSAARQYGLV